jgi:SAM-dependent methyltransferase
VPQPGNEEIRAAYDKSYSTPNHFGDRVWLFRPFVRALLGHVGLRPGSRVLDAGCGQGLFSSLFAEAGMNVLGVDMSEVGIQSARQHFGHSGARYEVGDVLALEERRAFDLVFTRSLSLYNVADFTSSTAVTERLLRYVRPGGTFVFDYYTRLRRASQQQSGTWRYHTLDEARLHFSAFPDARVRFSTRLETPLLGRGSFARPVTAVAAVVSRITGLGGELVAMLPVTAGQEARRAA